MQVDKLVETKGLDYVDREKAKRHAKQQAEQIYDQQYGNRDVGDGGGNWGNVGQQYGVGGGGGMLNYAQLHSVRSVRSPSLRTDLVFCKKQLWMHH